MAKGRPQVVRHTDGRLMGCGEKVFAGLICASPGSMADAIPKLIFADWERRWAVVLFIVPDARHTMVRGLSVWSDWQVAEPSKPDTQRPQGRHRSRVPLSPCYSQILTEAGPF